MGATVGVGFENGPWTARATALMAGWVPARAVLALLFLAAVEKDGMLSHLGGTDMWL